MCIFIRILITCRILGVLRVQVRDLRSLHILDNILIEVFLYPVCLVLCGFRLKTLFDRCCLHT